MATVEIVVIFAVGLAPAIFSGWYVWKFCDRVRNQSIAARVATTTGILSPIPPRRIRTRTRTIGDRTCEFNARSPHLRCVVNPQGPCRDCRDYQPKGRSI